jgi:acyl-CoA dehydrogenase
MTDKSYLKWPFFEERHHQLAIALDDWAIQNIPDLTTDESDTDATCNRLVKKLAEDKWLAYCVPNDIHQSKLDVRSLCLIREILAQHHGLADFTFAMQGLGSGAITFFGNDELRHEYLPAVRDAHKIAAFALTEPDAGSDISALSTSAKPDGNFYILNGTKTWISNGGIADFYTVFARTGEAPGVRGLSAFIVDADTPGLEITERIEVIAPHPLATLTFNDCRIPRGKMLGMPGQGFKIAMATLDIFRSTVGAAALGFARRALDETISHTTKRQLFGTPLSELQMTQATLADMAVAIDASALLVYRAAWCKDSGAERITREAAMAKLFATESAQHVIDSAVQLFGGLGVRSGMPVEKLYREIRALRIYEGASEIQKLIIAKQALEQFTESSQQ